MSRLRQNDKISENEKISNSIFSEILSFCLDLDIYQATKSQDPSRLLRLAEWVCLLRFSNYFMAWEPKYPPGRSKTLSVRPISEIHFFRDIAMFLRCCHFPRSCHFASISPSTKLQNSRTSPDFSVSSSEYVCFDFQIVSWHESDNIHGDVQKPCPWDQFLKFTFSEPIYSGGVGWGGGEQGAPG